MKVDNNKIFICWRCKHQFKKSDCGCAACPKCNSARITTLKAYYLLQPKLKTFRDVLTKQ